MNYRKVYSTFSKVIIALVVVINTLLPVAEQYFPHTSEFSDARVISLWVVLAIILPLLFSHFETLEGLARQNRTRSRLWKGRPERAVRQKLAEGEGHVVILLNDTGVPNLKKLLMFARNDDARVFVGSDFLETCDEAVIQFIADNNLALEAVDYRGGASQIVYKDGGGRIDAIDFYLAGEDFFRVEIDHIKTSNFEIFDVSKRKSLRISDDLQLLLARKVIGDLSKYSEGLFGRPSIPIHSRETLFETVLALIRAGKSTLHAIDFLPPDGWFTVPVLKEYAAAQADFPGRIVRVHVVQDEDYLSANRKSYESYVSMMLSLNVELYFIYTKDFIEQGFETRGSLIIDDSVGMVTVNPQTGVPHGELTMDGPYLAPYRERFSRILQHAQLAEEFMQIRDNQSNVARLHSS